MNNNLLVNPFLTLESLNNKENDFVLSAPKPGGGLKKLEIKKSEQPNLHEVFLDLAQTKFDFLDVEKDIDQIECDLLEEYGILVKKENVPSKVLFECFLDEAEVEVFSEDFNDLIVNPTFHFEGFNFDKFLWRVHKQHLSPHHSSVWIKQPITEIEIGYWLNNEQSEILSKFIAGKKPEIEIEPQLMARLVKSEILTTKKRFASNEKELREKLEQAKEFYEKNKYAVIAQLLPKVQMKAMRRYYRKYIASGFMPFGDGQVNRRYYQHNEPLARVIHQNLAKLMSFVIGEEVIPSYVYAAHYIENAYLEPHTDRAQCEFSISFQIDYLPEPDNNLSPWGLFVWEPEFAEGKPIAYLSNKFPGASEIDDKNQRVYLASGDGLVYKGCELIHYRYPLPKDHQSTSLFFHYVGKDFEGGLN